MFNKNKEEKIKKPWAEKSKKEKILFCLNVLFECILLILITIIVVGCIVKYAEGRDRKVINANAEVNSSTILPFNIEENFERYGAVNSAERSGVWTEPSLVEYDNIYLSEYTVRNANGQDSIRLTINNTKPLLTASSRTELQSFLWGMRFSVAFRADIFNNGDQLYGGANPNPDKGGWFRFDKEKLISAINSMTAGRTDIYIIRLENNNSIYRIQTPMAWSAEDLEGQLQVLYLNDAVKVGEYGNGPTNELTAYWLGPNNFVSLNYFNEIIGNNYNNLQIRYEATTGSSPAYTIIAGTEQGSLTVNRVIRNVIPSKLNGDLWSYSYPTAGGSISEPLKNFYADFTKVIPSEGYGVYFGSVQLTSYYYQQGYSSGYSVGYEAGFNAGNKAEFNPVSTMLEPAIQLLNVKLFGDFSIGSFFAVALFVMLALAFLKMFAGG